MPQMRAERRRAMVSVCNTDGLRGGWRRMRENASWSIAPDAVSGLQCSVALDGAATDQGT